MSDSSRRGFLKLAGAGVAAAGVATVAPNSAAKSASTEPAAALPKGASGSLMAVINDVHTGEVAVMVEGKEVTFTDHQLVARLATALHTQPAAADATI